MCCVCYLLFVTECGISVQVLQQGFSGCLVIIPDKSQPEQETPECILLILHRPLLCSNPLAVLRHLHKGGDKLCVGGNFLWATGNVEPRETNLTIGYLIGKRIRTQCLPQ